MKSKPAIICLQEVFVETRRNYYKTELENGGYIVLIPHDDNVSFLNSGLLTAVLKSKYDCVSQCFHPFLQYHNIEILSNKGFYKTTLIDRLTNRVFLIINTHMQSDTEITWFIGRKGTHKIRTSQHQQIVDSLHKNVLAFLVGDLNTEHSPHSSVRYMTLLDESRLKKSTFYSTGENLDHCAWFPLQWTQEDTLCSFCDFNRRGPRIVQCEVYQVPFSDHAPVRFSLFIPRLEDIHG
jgi:hypothetical protein